MKRILIAAILVAPVACSDSKDSKKNNTPDTVVDAPVVPDGATNPTEPTTPTTPTTPETPETPAQPEQPSYAVTEFELNATEKGVWVYFGLNEGGLVSMTKDQAWIIGVNRYMWQTNSGSSGPATVGGGYLADKENFDAVTSCDSSKFTKDQVLTVSGFTSSINAELTQWLDFQTLEPLGYTYVIGRETECIKLTALTYDAGLYKIKLQRLK